MMSPRHVVSALLLVALAPNPARAQYCPAYVPLNAGQSLDIWLTKPSNNNCAVTDGSYILKGSVLRLDAKGTAYGWCERWYPLPTCHVINTYQRNMADIDAWDDILPPLPDYYSTAYARNTAGSCRIGISHDIDTRSYATGSGCGLFGIYTATYDRDYTITAEGDIQPTPCDITPVNTEIETISFHSRCAISRGTACAGTLAGGGGPSPVNGLGFEHYHGNDPADPYDIYGSCNWIHTLIRLAGASYNYRHPGELVMYGDMSKPGGGEYLPHHCHDNGLAVDVLYPNTSGIPTEVDLTNPAHSFDRARMIDMLNALVIATAYNGYLVESFRISDKINISPQDLARSVPIFYDAPPDHQDHFHVMLTDGDGPDAACY